MKLMVDTIEGLKIIASCSWHPVRIHQSITHQAPDRITFTAMHKIVKHIGFTTNQ